MKDSGRSQQLPPDHRHTWRTKMIYRLICYLTCDIEKASYVPLSDFEQVRRKIQPADVLLIEGRSRISRVISTITKSAWTHAAVYLGCLKDIKNDKLRVDIQKHYHGAVDIPLVIESRLESGVVILPLNQYHNEHVRICRPKGLSEKNIQQVLDYAVERVGLAYDHQQIFDLARFLLPWFLLPRRWRSSLFSYKTGANTKISCSLLIAEAFMSIRYPILPLVRQCAGGGYEFIRRNVRLFTPGDFDYSPYFDVIKCPVVDFSDAAPHTTIPWNDDWVSHDNEGVEEVVSSNNESND